MKSLTPIVLAGAALAFCGCSTADPPLFARDKSVPAPTTASQSTTDEVNALRESTYEFGGSSQSGGSMGGNGASGGMPNTQVNPYGH